MFDYQLKNGIANLNVSDVTRVESSRFDCPASNTEIKGKGSGTVTYNYKAGTVVVNATSSGFIVDCTYTIPAFTDTTITDSNSIHRLFEDWGDDYDTNPISMQGSSCPKSTPDDTQPDNSKPPTEEELKRIIKEFQSCNIEVVRNITVKDDTNKVHKVAQAGSISFSFLFLFVAGLFRRFQQT